MRNILFIGLVLAIFPCLLISQERLWVYFIDKGIHEKLSFQKQRELISEYLTDRAIERRNVRGFHSDAQNLMWQDLPIDPEYIRQLEMLGFRIHGKSRWFNAVSGYSSQELSLKIEQLSFVKGIEAVHSWYYIKDPLTSANAHFVTGSSSAELSGFDYGPSRFQTEFHGIDQLHEKGLNGDGVIVAIFDTGFRLQNPSLQHIPSQLIGEYDFIQMDDVTSNQQGDRSDQDSHGTLVLSILGGFEEVEMIGPAYAASFILAKTEIEGEDIHMEEDNWAMAAEWAEQLGADIVSSSLEYYIFGSGQEDYTYEDMDGKSTIVTKAANELAKRGVLVISSAGNEGNKNWRYITAPADGIYVVAVGALTSTNVIASFSSRGPTFDGRIKPDITALGVSVYGASTSIKYNYRTANGTSVSCPIAAGIAAQLLQDFPYLNMLNLLDILRASGDNANSPDNERGWGKVDALKAWTLASGETFGLPQTVKLQSPRPNPYFRGNGIIFFRMDLLDATPLKIEIYTVLGQKIKEINFIGTLGQNLIPWNVNNEEGNPVAAGIYIYRISGAGWEAAGKLSILN
jgi:serine protease AprX